MEDIKETKVPSRCPHCRKCCSTPPSWVGVLNVLSGGRGKPSLEITAPVAAPLLGVGRKQAYDMFKKALVEKAIEPTSRGSNTYRKSKYGTQILSRWLQTGWVYRKPRRQRR